VGIYGTSEPELLAALGWVGLFPAPALSSDGKRLVYADSFFDTAITRLQLSDGPTQPVATKLIDSTRLDLYGEYSPDGSRIAFSSDRSGDFEIWVSELDGSKPVQLTSLSSSSAGLCSDPRWSPDGDQILFAAVREGLRYIWVVSSEGGAARPLTSGQSIDLQANWSRDGEWVYFTSNRGDQFDVWKVRFDGGDPFQVTTTGGANATESVDGEWLFYIKDPSPTWETSLWRIPARGGPEEKVLETIIRSYFVAEDGIFFISQTHPIHGRDSSYSDAYLQLYRFESRESEVIAAVKMGWKSEGLSVSADGRSFLFTDAVQEAGDLVMLEDFQ
jgi:Tol biopolymer transport system component